MTTTQHFKKLFLSTVLTVLFFNKGFSQQVSDFEYLISCFKASSPDSSELEIKGIGNVHSIDLVSNEMTETGLSYYYIPQEKKNKSTDKLAGLASARHIQTWKNNSQIIAHDHYQIGEASIVDLRLHILIEDIYLQVIVICDKARIYEIVCFRDKKDKSHFDKLIGKVKEQNCLQP